MADKLLHHCWPTSHSSTFCPSLGAVGPEQATPIDLKISTRKKTRTTKTNRIWGEKLREIACSDGRASAVPTVLWLAQLEVPDPDPDPEWETRAAVQWVN